MLNNACPLTGFKANVAAMVGDAIALFSQKHWINSIRKSKSDPNFDCNNFYDGNC